MTKYLPIHKPRSYILNELHEQQESLMDRPHKTATDFMRSFFRTMMMFRNLFLSTLALPLGFAIGSPNLLQLLDFVDNERRLQGNSQGNGNSQFCDDPNTLFYNAFFTLNDLSEQAAVSCTEEDYVIMGLLIQDIVKQIDQDFPKYKNEFIDTSVCAVPAWSFGEATQNSGVRALIEKARDWGHRRLATYTYRAGGSCRRCTGRRQLAAQNSGVRALLEDGDRRRLNSFPYTAGGKCRKCNQTASSTVATKSLSGSEAADVACDIASTAKFAVSVCEMGNEYCKGVLNDIADLLAKHPKLTTAKAGQKLAVGNCDLIGASVNAARSASVTADEACVSAEEKAILGQDSGAGEEMLEADTALEIASSSAVKVQDLYAAARAVKYGLMREIMEMDFLVRDQKLRKLLAEERKNYKATISKIEAEIRRLQNLITKATKKSEKESAMVLLEAQSEMLALQQRKHAELEQAMAAWIDEVQDANDFGKMMDQYTFELSTATSLDAWLEEYRNLLQDAIPKYLYDVYNTTGAGCLDPIFEDEFTVTVEIVEVAGRNETLSDKCESPDFASRP